MKEYSNFTAVGDVKLNGKLTLGENTADNGGVRLAFMALMDMLDGRKQEKIDGFTPQQRFFLGYAQIWCQNVRPEEARMRAFTDPHSPGEFRVNGVVSNSHAIPGGVRLHGRPADGARKLLPGVVTAAPARRDFAMKEMAARALLQEND